MTVAFSKSTRCTCRGHAPVDFARYVRCAGVLIYSYGPTLRRLQSPADSRPDESDRTPDPHPTSGAPVRPLHSATQTLTSGISKRIDKI